MRRRLRDQSGASAHPQGPRGEHKNPSPGVFSDHSLAGRAIVVSQNAGACGTRDRSAWRRHEPLAPLRFPVRPVEGCQPRGAREQEDRRSAQRSLRSTRFAAPAACVGADQPLAQLGGQSQLETSIHLRRLLATIATLALLGSLVAIAPASVAASGIQSRTITKAGTGSISTGTFTPSAQTGDPLELQDEMAGDEGADNQEAGPDPYDGAISLSSGRGRGASVNSASKAKSNPSFKFGFEGLNHYQQRYSRGGNQFSVEPPDQGMCAGNGFILETVNQVMNVFD